MVKLVYKIWREKLIPFLAKLVSMNIGIKINMENILNTINLDNLASCGRSNTLEVSHEYEARQSRWNTLYLDSDSYQALLSKAMNKLYYQTVSTITQKTKWVEVLENYAQGTRRDGIQRHSTYTRRLSSILANTMKITGVVKRPCKIRPWRCVSFVPNDYLSKNDWPAAITWYKNQKG